MRLCRRPALPAIGPAELLAYDTLADPSTGRFTRRLPPSVIYLSAGFAGPAGPCEAAALPAAAFLLGEVLVPWTELLSMPPCLCLN